MGTGCGHKQGWWGPMQVNAAMALHLPWLLAWHDRDRLYALIVETQLVEASHSWHLKPANGLCWPCWLNALQAADVALSLREGTLTSFMSQALRAKKLVHELKAMLMDT